MVITVNSKLFLLFLLISISLPTTVNAYNSRHFFDDEDAFSRYLSRYVSLNYKQPLLNEYVYNIKPEEDYPAMFINKNNYESMSGYDNNNPSPTISPFFDGATKRSLMGNKRGTSLKLKLLNQGARGFGKK